MLLLQNKKMKVYLHPHFNIISESSSVGRAIPCQGIGREFEPRLSLSLKKKHRHSGASFLKQILKILKL